MSGIFLHKYFWTGLHVHEHLYGSLILFCTCLIDFSHSLSPSLSHTLSQSLILSLSHTHTLFLYDLCLLCRILSSSSSSTSSSPSSFSLSLSPKISSLASSQSGMPSHLYDSWMHWFWLLHLNWEAEQVMGGQSFSSALSKQSKKMRGHFRFCSNGLKGIEILPLSPSKTQD